ncbi:MAG: lipoprotein NlpI [Ferrimonas sp.]
MNKLSTLLLLFMISGLSGCVSTATDKTQSYQSQYQSPSLLLATPRQSDPNLELQLLRIGELLSSTSLTPEQRAQLLYDRAIRYDALGLRTMARVDFTQGLSLQPNNSNFYNFLGIYATQAGDFDQAYESFGAVLELTPEFDYAYLNRGLASYYGGRLQLAIEDLTTFYQLEATDPYRALWLYLMEYDQDPAYAKKQLQQRRTQLDSKNWGYQLVRLYLGEINADELLISTRQNLTQQGELAERLCEAYFYLAKLARHQGRDGQAISFYKLSLASNIYEFVEHRYAPLEMRQIAENAMEARK